MATALGPHCRISGNQDYYGFWFGVDPKTEKVNCSVKIGKKGNAFSGTLTISAGRQGRREERGGPEAVSARCPSNIGSKLNRIGFRSSTRPSSRKY